MFLGKWFQTLGLKQKNKPPPKNPWQFPYLPIDRQQIDQSEFPFRRKKGVALLRYLLVSTLQPIKLKQVFAH